MRVVLLHQFLFLENIVDMLPYSLLVTVKQRGHLVSTEPYRLVLQLHIKLYAPVLRAVYLYAFCSFSMVSSYYITLSISLSIQPCIWISPLQVHLLDNYAFHDSRHSLKAFHIFILLFAY